MKSFITGSLLTFAVVASFTSNVELKEDTVLSQQPKLAAKQLATSPQYNEVIIATAPKLLDSSKWTAGFSNEQLALFKLAREIGVKYGYPETLQMILAQETLAGKLGRVGDNGDSLGVMQIQPPTAEFITRKTTTLPRLANRKAYAQRIKHDDRYAMEVAAQTFLYNMKVFNNDWRRAVVAYNAGIKGASRMTDEQVSNHAYLVGIRGKMKMIKRANLINTKV